MWVWPDYASDDLGRLHGRLRRHRGLLRRLGYTDYQIHVHYLSLVENPIGGLVIVAALGAILGGLGFALRSRMISQQSLSQKSDEH